MNIPLSLQASVILYTQPRKHRKRAGVMAQWCGPEFRSPILIRSDEKVSTRNPRASAVGREAEAGESLETCWLARCGQQWTARRQKIATDCQGCLLRSACTLPTPNEHTRGHIRRERRDGNDAVSQRDSRYPCPCKEKCGYGAFQS